MKIFNAFTLMSLAFVSSNAMRDIPSMELVKEIKIGWNLGNTLDAHCLDTLDYSLDTTASETCWGNVKTTPELFQKLSSLGFNIFRIPTTWTGHFGEGPDYKIDDAWMKRVHEVVDYALNTGSFAILNIHHENWNYAFAENLESAKVILEAIWKQIAEEFKEYDEHLISEGMNEPRKVDDPVEWTGGDEDGWNFVNELDNLFYQTIRASGGNNALRHLMLPSYAAACYGGAPDHLIYPENDNKIIISIHSYNPYNFALNNGEGAVSTFDDGSDIDYTMSEINKFFISKNVPVIMGEFGAMNRHNEDERAKWAEYYIKSARAVGVPCILWDNGIFEGEGERFAIIDRSQLKVAYPKLVTGLMKGLGIDNYQIPESDILELTEEEPTVVEPDTEEPVETIIPIPSIPDPVNPSDESILPPKQITTQVIPPQEVTSQIIPPKEVTSTQIVPPKEITTPEPNQAAASSSIVNPSYFTCEKEDWDCKAKNSDLCFGEVSKCWEYGKDPNTCIQISVECSKIWS